jgi:hypothetical protein
MYHSFVIIVATTILVLLAALLLTLFSSVPVWKCLDYVMQFWQHSAEGYVYSWPNSSVLLPTRN